jgi:hypothetical protein
MEDRVPRPFSAERDRPASGYHVTIVTAENGQW